MRVTTGCLIALGIVSVAGAGCVALGIRADDSYRPNIDPANFQTIVDNPYFPLAPGTIIKFTETAEGETNDNQIEVTRDTKVILGVKCVVVHDTVSQGGVLKEDTYDWYAQDKQGTVWYFGEGTKEFKPGGVVSTEGSWEAGVDGAQAGIIMPAHPKVGDRYRQEYYPGHAEDMAQIVELNDSVTVPYGTFKGCVRTDEWSMLEPGTEKKWYAKGVGVVREVSEVGDVAALVSMTPPK